MRALKLIRGIHEGEEEYKVAMKKQGMNKELQLPKECLQDQVIHPCGSTEFCPEDPEKCIFYKGGLR